MSATQATPPPTNKIWQLSQAWLFQTALAVEGLFTWDYLPSSLCCREISLEIPTVLQVKEWIIVLETVFGNREQQFCGEGPRILLWEDKGALQFLKITIKTQNSREDLWKKIEGLVGNACMKFMLITVITESKDTLHQEWAEIQRKEKEVLIKLC